jgi:WD40 repeat protein
VDGDAFRISPDTNLLAVAFPGGVVELRDAASLDLLHRFEHQAETPKYPPPGFDLNDLLRIRSLAFSPDGTTLAVGYGDQKIKLYDVEDGSLQYVLDLLYAPSPNALRFTPDGRFLVSDDLARGRNYQNKLGMWSVESGELISLINDAGRMGEFPFHPDSTRLVTTQFGGFVLVYSIPEGELVFDFGTGEIFPIVEYSADGDYFLVDGGAQVRAVQDGKRVTGLDAANLQPDRLAPVQLAEEQKWALGHVGGLGALKLDGQKIHLWGTSGRLVYHWDISLQEFSSFELDLAVRYITSLSVSLQGEWAVVCGDTRSSYRTLYRILPESGDVSEIGRCLGDIVLSPDGQYIFKNNRYFADILDSSTGELVKNIRDHAIQAFSTDGSYLLTERNDEKVYVWKSDLSRSYQLAENPPNMGSLMAVSPDGTIAVIQWDKLRFWRLSDGWQIKFLTINAASMAFSPSGAILAVGDSSGSIHLFEVPTWREIAILEGHRGSVIDLTFTPDGKNLLTASSDGTARLWGIHP